jgi:hypothetical protein
MEPEGPLLCSQELANCPYLEPTVHIWSQIRETKGDFKFNRPILFMCYTCFFFNAQQNAISIEEQTLRE